ncbi:hypothetical protein E4U21_002802 [Claviceps maximensis]|nr:hypothetical protein E4U21_002802 [Claviceps maximensis]
MTCNSLRVYQITTRRGDSCEREEDAKDFESEGACEASITIIFLIESCGVLEVVFEKHLDIQHISKNGSWKLDTK